MLIAERVTGPSLKTPSLYLCTLAASTGITIYIISSILSNVHRLCFRLKFCEEYLD